MLYQNDEDLLRDCIRIFLNYADDKLQAELEDGLWDEVIDQVLKEEVRDRNRIHIIEEIVKRFKSK